MPVWEGEGGGAPPDGLLPALPGHQGAVQQPGGGRAAGGLLSPDTEKEGQDGLAGAGKEE